MPTFQISLEAARVNAKITQKDAAKALGVSEQSIVNWEKGVRKPTIENALKLCELYGRNLLEIEW